MFRFDPVDAFLSAGSTLLGKALLFFSAGMAGLALGWVAGYCDSWSVLLHPLKTVEEVIASGEAGTAFAWLFLWPLVSLGAAARPWFFVFFALVAISVFAILVYSEEPPFLWWLVLIAVTSLVPAMSDLSNWASKFLGRAGCFLDRPGTGRNPFLADRISRRNQNPK